MRKERWLAERMQPTSGHQISTLKGGIAVYLTWMDEEIKAGRMTAKDSLFKGRNYVFDGRASSGLANSDEAIPVSGCHVCNKPCDRLSKCSSRGCHLVLVVCDACESMQDPRCCTSCNLMDAEIPQRTKRPICECELKREAKLRGQQSITEYAVS
jgi:predicted sulfurtransferase